MPANLEWWNDIFAKKVWASFYLKWFWIVCNDDLLFLRNVPENLVMYNLLVLSDVMNNCFSAPHTPQDENLFFCSNLWFVVFFLFFEEIEHSSMIDNGARIEKAGMFIDDFICCTCFSLMKIFFVSTGGRSGQVIFPHCVQIYLWDLITLKKCRQLSDTKLFSIDFEGCFVCCIVG